MHVMKTMALLAVASGFAAVNLATAQTKAPQFMFVQTAKNVTFKDGVLTLLFGAP